MKILYVEDNEDNVFVLQSRLERLGHTVLTAADGIAGVAAALAEQPDLIVMDLSLPRLDGWAATRQLKADARTRRIPVVALTSHAMVGERERALAAGCDEFETKPVDLPRLLAKMHALTGTGPQT